MMRKRIQQIVCMGLMMLPLFALPGCRAAAPASTPEPASTPLPTATPAPTKAPTPTPVPEGEFAVARVDGVGAIHSLWDRGDTADVAGEEGAYYLLRADGADVLVEKRFVRLASDAPYASWTGYAKPDALVYATAYMENAPIAALPFNAKVTVQDAIGDMLLIAWDEQQGYTRLANIGKTRADAGKDGGGSSNDNDNESGVGVDGGDILLSLRQATAEKAVRLIAFRAAASSPAPNAAAPAFPCAGTILADKAEAYLAIFHRGDAVTVVGFGETEYQVLVNGGIGTVPKRLLRLVSEAGYAGWDGYADDATPLCSDYRLQNELETLTRNTKVHVWEDLGSCYLVKAGDKFGCAPKKNISNTMSTASSGNGNPEWTDPVL